MYWLIYYTKLLFFWELQHNWTVCISQDCISLFAFLVDSLPCKNQMFCIISEPGIGTLYSGWTIELKFSFAPWLERWSSDFYWLRRGSHTFNCVIRLAIKWVTRIWLAGQLHVFHYISALPAFLWATARGRCHCWCDVTDGTVMGSRASTGELFSKPIKLQKSEAGNYFEALNCM